MTRLAAAGTVVPVGSVEGADADGASWETSRFLTSLVRDEVCPSWGDVDIKVGEVLGKVAEGIADGWVEGVERRKWG